MEAKCVSTCGGFSPRIWGRKACPAQQFCFLAQNTYLVTHTGSLLLTCFNPQMPPAQPCALPQTLAVSRCISHWNLYSLMWYVAWDVSGSYIDICMHIWLYMPIGYIRAIRQVRKVASICSSNLSQFIWAVTNPVRLSCSIGKTTIDVKWLWPRSLSMTYHCVVLVLPRKFVVVWPCVILVLKSFSLLSLFSLYILIIFIIFIAIVFIITISSIRRMSGP